MGNGINVFCYQHVEYGGATRQIFRENPGFVWNRNLGSWNDVISSVKVLSGYVAFFVDEDFGNSVYMMGPGTSLPDLRNDRWNDVITSFIACDRHFDAVAAASNLRNSDFTNPGQPF